MKQTSDEDLMLAYQNDDFAAIQELYRRHSGMLFTYLRHHLRNDEWASDVLQNSFLKLHRTREKYLPIYSFKAWIYTIVRTQMFDEIKKQRRHNKKKKALQHEIQNESFTEQPEFQKDKKIELPLQHLKDQQLQILNLRIHEELPFSEIARRLNTTSEQARQSFHRTLKFLKGLL